MIQPKLHSRDLQLLDREHLVFWERIEFSLLFLNRVVVRSSTQDVRHGVLNSQGMVNFAIESLQFIQPSYVPFTWCWFVIESNQQILMISDDLNRLLCPL